MEALLVFPPMWTMTRVYAALPYLAGFLKQQGICVKQWDLNIEFLHWMFSETFVRDSLQMVQEKLRHRSVSDAPDRDWLFGLYRQGSINPDELLRELEDCKALFTKGIGYFDIPTFLDAVQILDRLYDLSNFRYFPTKISFSRIEMPYSYCRSEQVFAATKDELTNPFLDFYRTVALPRLLAENPDVLGISLTSVMQIIPGFTLARLVKEVCPTTHITIGGNVVTRLKSELPSLSRLFNFVDSAIVFDGERPLLELISELSGKRNFDRVPNLIYRQNGCLRATALCRPIFFNRVPSPDFDDIDLGRYFSPVKVLPVLITKGCYWGKCTFCDIPFGKTISIRKPDRVVDDIRGLQQKYNASHFTFVDEAMHPAIMEEISNKILTRELQVTWDASLRFEKEFLSLSLLCKARDAGCIAILFGLESASERIQEIINKGIDINSAGTILKNCSDADIFTCVSFMFGIPTETVHEAKESIEFIRRYRDHIGQALISIYVPKRYSVLGKELFQDLAEGDMCIYPDDLSGHLDNGIYQMYLFQSRLMKRIWPVDQLWAQLGGAGFISYLVKNGYARLREEANAWVNKKGKWLDHVGNLDVAFCPCKAFSLLDTANVAGCTAFSTLLEIYYLVDWENREMIPLNEVQFAMASLLNGRETGRDILDVLKKQGYEGSFRLRREYNELIRLLIERELLRLV